MSCVVALAGSVHELAFAPRSQSEVPLGLGLVPSVELIRTASRWRNGRTKYSVSSFWLERRPTWPTGPHEGMCRGAAANAKKRLQTTREADRNHNDKMNNEPDTDSKYQHQLHCRRAFSRHVQDKRTMLAAETKKPRKQLHPRPSGSFFRPGLAIPCWVARQQRPTPFHQAATMYTKKNEAQSFERGRYVHFKKLRPEKMETAS